MPLLDTLKNIRSAPVPTNEENAKFKIISPILHQLGWDPYGPDVIFEHNVGTKRDGGRVDIALKGSKQLVALIEAKAPSADLDAHVGQVLGYAFHEGVHLCVLTTGVEWWLYLPREGGQPEDRRFTVLHVLSDPIEQLAEDLQTFLSNQTLEDGTALDQAKRVLKAQQDATLLSEKIPHIWRRMLDEADDELVEVVGHRIYREVNLRPSKEQVIAALRGQPVAPEPPEPEPGSNSGETPAPNGESPTPNPPVGTKPTAMVLFGTRYPINTHREGLIRLSKVLYERDPVAFGRLSAIRGKKIAYVASNSKGMRAPRQIGTYYIEAHASAKQIWSRARRFLKHLGYSDSVLEVKYD